MECLMSDFKSMLPDFKELASMTNKLYKGLKSSVEEIIHDYKEKRAEPEAQEKPKAEVKEKAKAAKPRASAKTAKKE